MEQKSPILAARTMEVDEGQVLLLWVSLEVEEAEIEMGYDDDFGDEADDDFGFFGYLEKKARENQFYQPTIRISKNQRENPLVLIF